MKKGKYIIVTGDAWLTADYTWTRYGPELAGYTTSYSFARQLAEQVGGKVKTIKASEAALLDKFDDNCC